MEPNLTLVAVTAVWTLSHLHLMLICEENIFAISIRSFRVQHPYNASIEVADFTDFPRLHIHIFFRNL